jgi:hypothetical protein
LVVLDRAYILVACNLIANFREKVVTKSAERHTNCKTTANLSITLALLSETMTILDSALEADVEVAGVADLARAIGQRSADNARSTVDGCARIQELEAALEACQASLAEKVLEIDILEIDNLDKKEEMEKLKKQLAAKSS